MQKQMTWAYLAGFFDGEGSIEMSFATNGQSEKRYEYIRCRIVQSTPQAQVLYEIAEFLARNGIVASVRPRNTRPMVTLTVARKADVPRFLKLVRPYLRVKAAKADEALAWLTQTATREKVK